MRKSILTLMVMLGLTSILASCFKDDTTDYSEYNDCAITAFALQDVEWTDTVLDQYGEDSTYTTSVALSSYSFTIDQVNGRIYNTDSLPVGTHLGKVLCTITADGNVVYQHDGGAEDETWYYLNNDSVDFSAPIEATCWSYSGAYSKKYTITVNVHQMDSVSSHWDIRPEEWAGKTLAAPRAVTYGEKVAVFGMQEGKLMVTTAPQGTMDWTEPAEVEGMSADAKYDNIVLFQDALYMVDGETLYVSDDAQHWTQLMGNTPVTMLMGCNTDHLFGVYNGEFLVTDDGTAWNAELTEYPEYIPDSNVFSFYAPYSTNLDLERTVTFGQQKESTDTIASAWYRTSGNQEGLSNIWSYHYTSRDNNYALPNLNNLVVLYYKKYLIAFGNDCRNRGHARAFGQLYVSKDWGLTWKGQDDEDYDTYLELPSELYRNTQEFASYIDQNNDVWILFSGTGVTYSGYLNLMKFNE